MEDEILKIMDSFEIVEADEIRNVKILEKDINRLIKANTNLADKVKDYRSDAYFLCNFIKETDDLYTTIRMGNNNEKRK